MNTDTTAKANFPTIAAIKHANHAAGYFFFEPDTMRFFNSHVLPTVYGGRYFITREQFDPWRHPEIPAAYTVREVSPGGDINTVGKFQEYPTVAEAKAAIRALLNA